MAVGFNPFRSVMGGGNQQQTQQTQQQDDGGGANNQQQNVNNQNAGANQADDNFDLSKSIWEDDDTDDRGNSQQQNNANNQQQQQNQNQQQAPVDSLQKFIDSMDLDVQVAQEDLEKFRNDGDMSVFQNMFKEFGQKVVKQQMQGTAQIVQAAVKKAVNEARQGAQVDYKSDQAVQTMHNRLDYTKNPNVDRIARGILGQMYKKHGDLDKAIDFTDKFFKSVSNHVGGGSEGNQGSGGTRRGIGKSPVGDDINWEEVFEMDG